MNKYPKHSNPTHADRVSSAPYNFIPLPEKVVPVDNVHQDVYMHNTGFIECKLTTESPLYTRCATNPEFFRQYGEPPSFDKLNETQKNERAQFFQLENIPVIPGSSLRGMVRSLVEIAGYGKIPWISNEIKIAYRAVAVRDDPLSEPYQRVMGKYGNKVHAGYLLKKEDGWYVHPAKKPSDLNLPDRKSYLEVKENIIPNNVIPSFIRFGNKNYKPQYHEIGFDTEIRKDRNNNPYTYIAKIGHANMGYGNRGFLVCSGNMMETGIKKDPIRKKHAIVLEQDPNGKKIKINEQTIKNYIEGLTEFQKDSPFNERMGCLINGHPIFYVVNNGQVDILGHCPNFRIPAVNSKEGIITSPFDFVPKYLTSENEMDLAEVIFGFVHGKQKTACAGRVFFTNAEFESHRTGIWFTEEPFTPKIMASPKPTTFPHYLVQDKDKNHDPDRKVQLAHYAIPSPDETVIRGHKEYWHRENISLDEIQEKDNEKIERFPKQYTKIKPVNRGVTFSFRIYFDNLRDYELGALLWVLTPREEDGKKYRHKLGMGKPLGLGSVKIEPKLHLSNRAKRYESLFDGNKWTEAMEEKSDIDSYIKKFEDFLWVKIDANEKETAKNFKDLARIKMLLKMLEFPGPDKELTRYLEIDEFKRRLVLPDPLHVGQSLLQSSASASSNPAKDFQRPKRKWRD